jgi:hypothetical protein
MTGDFELVKDGSYKKLRKNKNGYEYFLKGVCETCGQEFFKRKHKPNKFCSHKCSDEGKKNDIVEIFSSNTLDVLTGSLLSDGSYRKTKNNQNSSFTHLCKFEEYIDFLISELDFKVKKNKVFGYGKYNKGKEYFTIYSQANSVFTGLRNKWYPNGKKIVPKDVELNRTVLLHWFLGDGTLDNQDGVIFCSDSFTETDNMYLIDKLKKMGFDAYLKKDKNRIVIPNKSVFEFFNFIGESPVVCYNHKWDSKVHESYYGRVCKFCEIKFDAKHNHKKYCSDNCQKKHWKIIKDKKEDLAHSKM